MSDISPRKETSSEKDQRMADGRFAKGNRGGPGRPPRRSLSGTVLALDKLSAEAAPDVVKVALDLARRGNLTALGMVLERVWPKHRSRPLRLDLTPVETQWDAFMAHNALANAVFGGLVSPQEGAGLAELLGRYMEPVTDTTKERIRDVVTNEIARAQAESDATAAAPTATEETGGNAEPQP